MRIKSLGGTTGSSLKLRNLWQLFNPSGLQFLLTQY